MPWVKIASLQVRFPVSFRSCTFPCVTDLCSLHCFFQSLEPWNHLLFGTVGAYVGYNYKTWEASLLAKVNEKRVLRGMSPIDRQSMA